jgi:hypothetical protein
VTVSASYSYGTKPTRKLPSSGRRLMANVLAAPGRRPCQSPTVIGASSSFAPRSAPPPVRDSSIHDTGNASVDSMSQHSGNPQRWIVRTRREVCDMENSEVLLHRSFKAKRSGRSPVGAKRVGQRW